MYVSHLSYGDSLTVCFIAQWREKTACTPTAQGRIVLSQLFPFEIDMDIRPSDTGLLRRKDRARQFIEECRSRFETIERSKDEDQSIEVLVSAGSQSVSIGS